jgi:uncharacterized membrane protein
VYVKTSVFTLGFLLIIAFSRFILWNQWFCKLKTKKFNCLPISILFSILKSTSFVMSISKGIYIDLSF